MTLDNYLGLSSINLFDLGIEYCIFDEDEFSGLRLIEFGSD